MSVGLMLACRWHEEALIKGMKLLDDAHEIYLELAGRGVSSE